MKAIILAGGEGRRLRPLTDKLPKPMVPVMNRPMMSYLLRLLKRHGITEIGVTLGYRGEVIENYFKNGQEFGVNLTYFREEVPCGTAGSLQNAAEFLDQDFLVISGDAVTDINLTSALYFHSDKNALATLVLKELEYPLNYGVVVTEPGGRIRHIAEKPDWDQVRSDMVNTGIYIMNPKILSYIPKNTVYDFARDLFPCLLAQNQPLFGYVSKNYWCDIGDLAAYQRCHKDIFLGRVDLGFSRDSLQSGVLIGKDCQIASDAVIERFTVIGDHSIIGARASVKNSILWNGSRIPEDADLYRTVCCGQQSVYLPSQIESAKDKPEPEHNRFIGVINEDITPEFLIRLSIAYSDSLHPGAKILISLSDNSRYMMLKFALLSGLISGGAKAYNLVGGGDRSVAKFALRKLSLDGGIHAQLDGQKITLELLDQNGAAASAALMKTVKTRLAGDSFHRADPAHFYPPVNINRMSLYYFRDLVSTTPSKRLNFSVAVCCQTPETQENLKKIGTAFGLSIVFTNDSALMPELIQKNKLDFGLLIGENGKFGLLDEHGSVINGDNFYGLTTLIVLSAIEAATVFMPQHASSVVDTVADACGGSVRRVADDSLEPSLLADGKAAARLQHDICFDPIRCLIRVCEFLYLNQCSLSSVCRLLPVMHKISRQADCPPEKKGYVMRKILSELGSDKSVDLTDGIKISDDRGWILIMPDYKGHKIHVLTESAREEFAQELAGGVCRKIEELISSPSQMQLN